MKRFSCLFLALLAANLSADTPSTDQKQCLKMDQEDTTDTLAIPLDEDAYDQCEELEKLEQGKKPKQ